MRRQYRKHISAGFSYERFGIYLAALREPAEIVDYTKVKVRSRLAASEWGTDQYQRLGQLDQLETQH